MNLIDYLFRMDLEELNKIALRLEAIPEGKFTRNWVINKITEILLNIDKLKNRVFHKMKNVTVSELVISVFTEEPPSPDSVVELTSFGLAFEGEIPTDIKDLIWTNGRSLAVKELQDQQFTTKHSVFLKFIQLLLFLKRKNSFVYNFKKNQKHLKKITDELVLNENEGQQIHQLINVLIRNSFLKREKNKLYFNWEKYKKWVRQDSIISIKEFYKQIGNFSDVNKCLENISRLQEKENEWVNLSFLPKVLLGIKGGIENGLIRNTKFNGKDYVQLSPEGWFLIKGNSPPSWVEKTLLVSADFELFIPHTYDPFIHLDIEHFCTLSQNNYIVVYEINPFLEDNQNEHFGIAENFFSLIKRKSRSIPNVVEFEFENKRKNSDE